MKPDKIAELRRMLTAATPGPWDWSGTCLGHDTGSNTRTCIWHEDEDPGPNHLLIAAAVNALPELLDAAEQIHVECRQRDRAVADAVELQEQIVRLTRERDEAVRENTVLLHRANSVHDLETECRTLVRERDDARAELEAMTRCAKERIERAKQAERERDETMRELMRCDDLLSYKQKDRDEARAVLRQIEWSASVDWIDPANAGSYTVDACPACDAARPNGHTTDCALARALGANNG